MMNPLIQDSGDPMASDPPFDDDLEAPGAPPRHAGSARRTA